MNILECFIFHALYDKFLHVFKGIQIKIISKILSYNDLYTEILYTIH